MILCGMRKGERDFSPTRCKGKDFTLGIRKSSAYHWWSNLATLLCFPSSTFPSSNPYSLRHIAHHIPFLSVYPQPQAMAEAKGKGKEVEREETVVEGKLNSLLLLALIAELPQGASCSLWQARDDVASIFFLALSFQSRRG
jgi:hypothetical protein